MSCFPLPNNPCNNYPNTDCVVYTGANLVCSGIRTNDRLTTILAKLDSKLCTVVPPGADRVYYGSDFTDSTHLNDTTLVGLRFRLFYRGMGSFLIKAIEWDYINTGGFHILIPNFMVDPLDVFFVQFY